MFTLIKDNVERIVLDESARDSLIKEGFKDVEIKIKSESNKLTLEQLKILAIEKGIEFDDKIKKADLVVLIEAKEKETAEDGE